MKENINLNNEEEETADNLGLWKPIEILVMSKILWMNNQGESLYSLNIHNKSHEYHVSKKDILNTVFHLGKENLLVVREEIINNESKYNIVHIEKKAMEEILHLPSKWNELTEEEFYHIIDPKIEKAYKEIITWNEVKKIPKEVETTKQEVENIKEELKKSQSDLLRNMVSVFGIFVAIFSFVVIGANTALNIESEAIPQVVVILFLIFTYSTLLLYFSIRYSKR